MRRILMKNKSSGVNKKWIQTKAFYGVAVSLILVIIGVGTAIFNVAKIKNNIPNSQSSTVYSVPDITKNTSGARANANKTDVADNRTEATTQKTTANDLNRPYTGYYLLPLNSKVSKDYSDGDMVYSNTMGDWRTHDGIDIGGNIGDNVIAVQDGKVTNVYSDDLWGDVVEIQHGNGLSAKYCGVKASVSKDDSIEQGQVIGTLVEIPVESKDGNHIHLEIYVDKETVSPVKALNMLNDSAGSTQAE
jgi:murein DD-endopeptidase MepM/ murein hydrolase activator NlpD